MNRRKSVVIMILLIPILTVAVIQPVNAINQEKEPFSDKEHVYDLTAGYADELYFRIIQGDEQNVLALQAGVVDLIGQFVDLNLVPPLIADPEIEINQTNRLGFGHLSFNTGREPTNRRELRQAFAYALDKDGIQVRAHDGMSRPVDSPIPPSMGKWSLDNDPWSKVNNYYDPDPVKGNAILDAHGWVDVNSDGWREDPDGNPVDFPIYFLSTSRIAATCVEMGQEAFDRIHIKTKVQPTDYGSIMARVANDDFYMYFADLDTPDPYPLLLQSFQTGDLSNDWNWSNETYDTLVGEAFATIDEPVVLEKILEAQKILWYEQPLVVAYQNLLFSCYRKDPWTGWVNTNGMGVFDYWTYLKVQLKPEFGSNNTQYTDYTQGGRFTVSLDYGIETTNLLNTSLIYTSRVMNLIYDTLYKCNPYNLEVCPWLAKDWKIEEVSSSTIRAKEGDKLKITFYLHNNLSWHDGQSLTAEDVVFSYQLISDSQAPHYSNNVRDVTHVEVVNRTIVEVFTNNSGLFTFHRINVPIFPKHIWQNVANPRSWSNPRALGSGPYIFKSRSPNELIVLERNDDFIYNPRYYPIPEPPEPPETSGNGEPEFTSGFLVTAVISTLAGYAISLKKKNKKR